MMKRTAVRAAACLSALLVGCADFSSGPTEPTGPLPSADRYASDVPVAWFGLAYRLVQMERLTPPVASRVFGYAGVALYETVVPGMPGYRFLAGQVAGLPAIPTDTGGIHWPAAANRALAVALGDLFAQGSPAAKDSIAILSRRLEAGFGAEATAAVLARSNARGERVGRAIASWAATDWYLEMHACPYSPPSAPGLWVPTAPGFRPALEPCWGRLRPFVVRSAMQCDPGPPPVYSEAPGSPFYLEGREVYDVVQGLTPEQLAIAVYWADDPGTTGTPPGHSISILSQILVQRRSRLDRAAEAYAKVGMAVADAFISCWATKYQYNLLRPITYVRRLFQADWLSPVGTPSFPEYTSGHSVQSGAAAEVLADLFGDIPFVDRTHDALGHAPRSFATFDEFAQEAAISRLYGGIHFRSAIDLGVAQGRCVGRAVNGLRMRD